MRLVVYSSSSVISVSVRTGRSDRDDDTESSEDGERGTDDDLHGVVWRVVGCSGTVWAKSDKVG
jgi:hypothetical protein